MKLLHMVAAAAVATAVAPVLSAAAAESDAEPKYNIMGPATCARWPAVGAISSAGKAVPLNWALGFLSGWAAEDDLRLLFLIDPETVDSWLTTHCKEHPSDTLPIAVRELQAELEAKLPKRPPPEPAAPPMFFNPVAPVATEAKTAPSAKAKPKPKPKAKRRKPAAPAAAKT